MSETHPLAERERALENLFFEAENKRLIEALHARVEHDDDREELATTLGIDSEDLLEALLALGIRKDNVAALILSPLIALAWADGQIDASERAAIHLAEADHRIPKEGKAAHLLEIWLEHRPHASLLDTWSAYTEMICDQLSETDRAQLKRDILGRAHRLTNAFRKAIFRGNGPTESEAKVLAQIEAAFEANPAARKNDHAPMDAALRSMT